MNLPHRLRNQSRSMPQLCQSHTSELLDCITIALFLTQASLIFQIILVPLIVSGTTFIDLKLPEKNSGGSTPLADSSWLATRFS